MKTILMATLLGLGATNGAMATDLVSYCDSQVCDVTRFPGATIDEKIQQAMQAATLTAHKNVFFPAGYYYLKRTIGALGASMQLNFIGSGSQKTVLVSAPIVSSYFDEEQKVQCTGFGSVFSFSRSGGFDFFQVSIQRLSIDMSPVRQHPSFAPDKCYSAGHGIRVGSGWKEGRLYIQSVRILDAAGYGIGIQNNDTVDVPNLPANNIEIRNVYIARSGSDAIDTKRPAAGNSNLTITNLTIDQIGYNDEWSAAGLDISYDNFYIKGVTIVTDATRANPRGVSSNAGVRFRRRASGGPIQHGILRELRVEGATYGVYFEGDQRSGAEDVVVKNAIIRGYTKAGVVARGRKIGFKNGCVVSDKSKLNYNLPASSKKDKVFFVMSTKKSDCERFEAIVGAQSLPQ